MTKIFPGFVKKIDNYLLENHPAIWATRVHLHLALVIPLTIAFLAIALIYPVDLYHGDSQWQSFALCIIISIALGLYFLYTIALHNSDKRQGIRFRFQSRVELLCYLMSIGSTMLIPYFFPMVLNAKYAALMDEKVVCEEINTLNKGRVYFMDNYSDFKYFLSDEQYKTYMYKRRNNYNEAQEYYDQTIQPQWSNDWEAIREGRVKLYCTDIEWANLYYEDHATYASMVLDGDALVQHYLSAKSDEEMLAEINAFIQVYKKNEKLTERSRYYYSNYSVAFPEAEHVLAQHKANVFNSIYENDTDGKLSYYNIDDVHRNVMRAKYNFYREWKYIGITLLIIALSIASLLYVFKNIPWRQFIALVIIMALYPVVAGIIEAVSRADGNLFFFGILAMFFIGVAQLYLIPSKKEYSRFTAIMLGYAAALMPFIPIILLFYTDEILDMDFFHISTYNAEYDTYYNDYNRELKNMMYWGFLWSGIGLYVLFFTSTFKTAFMRLYALPRKK